MRSEEPVVSCGSGGPDCSAARSTPPGPRATHFGRCYWMTRRRGDMAAAGLTPYVHRSQIATVSGWNRTICQTTATRSPRRSPGGCRGSVEHPSRVRRATSTEGPAGRAATLRRQIVPTQYRSVPEWRRECRASGAPLTYSTSSRVPQVGRRDDDAIRRQHPQGRDDAGVGRCHFLDEAHRPPHHASTKHPTPERSPSPRPLGQTPTPRGQIALPTFLVECEFWWPRTVAPERSNFSGRKQNRAPDSNRALSRRADRDLVPRGLPGAKRAVVDRFFVVPVGVEPQMDVMTTPHKVVQRRFVVRKVGRGAHDEQDFQAHASYQQRPVQEGGAWEPWHISRSPTAGRPWLW